jgi:hypothetical protein
MSAPAKPARRRLTLKQWAEAEAMWESGNSIYDDLVAKFGGHVSTFERHFKRRGIVKGAKAAVVKKKVEQKLAAIAEGDAVVTAQRIRETKEDHYKFSVALARLAWNEIVVAREKKAPISVAMANLKALNMAMNVFKKTREERYSVLGLDRPDAIDVDELPELVISELTAAEVDALRARDHLDIDGLEGAVVATGDDGQPGVVDSSGEDGDDGSDGQPDDDGEDEGDD